MPITFQSKVARSDKYRADIDGLRAVAVLPVLLFHAGAAGFSGGFVGVDIFFVISGYLITSIIQRDIVKGSFSFVSFYERRVRRIFPALFSVVFFCVLTALILFVPKDLLEFAKSSIAATLFASNEWFKRTSGPQGYFDQVAESKVLLHTWSLAVEEQFYLFFPAALLLLARWKDRMKRNVALITSISFAISVWSVHYRPLSAFYSLIPRAWELLIGALLAMKAVPPLKSRWSREIAAAIGLALIVWAVYMYSGDTAFPGPSALLPCFGAWLIIYAGESGTSCVGTALSAGPLVFIGAISYSLYLWHWPIIVFSRYFAAGDLTPLETTGALLIAVLMAFLSFEFIEAPFRGRESRFNRKRMFALGLTASMATLVLGGTIVAAKGLPNRYSAPTQQLIIQNLGRLRDFDYVCGNWKTQVHDLTDISFCNLGPAASKKIMFWGDSHVQQLYPVIKALSDEGEMDNHGVVLAIAQSCPPVEHLNIIANGFHCDAFAHFAMVRAEMPDVDTVFIGFDAWWSTHAVLCPSVDGKCTEKISAAEAADRFLQELADHIRKLRTDGKRVIVCLPFPVYDKLIPQLEIRNAIFGGLGLAAQAENEIPFAMSDRIQLIARREGADIFDPRESLCDGQQCLTQINGVSIYTDQSHIAASQVDILERSLKRVLLSVWSPAEKLSQSEASQSYDSHQKEE